MITLKSVIVAFLFAISLWFLFSYHKGTCSTQSNPSVVCLTTGTCSSASGGTFENATDGTFHSATAGTFVSAMPGTFVSATGGTFNPLLSNEVFDTDLGKHNRQYTAIKKVQLPQKEHDRFLIIDDTVYILGDSLKNLGHSMTTALKTSFTVEEILGRLGN